MAINYDSINAFSGKEVNYSLYRPGYHPSLIDYVKNIIPKNAIVADIGCGTGILTKQLLDNNIKTIGIEPNVDMLNKAKKYLSGYKCKFINAYAENTLLDNNSIDLIVIATALHWFNLDDFIKESKRILKSNGKVAVIYNNMDKGNSVVDEYLDIHRTLCPKYRGGFDKLELTYNNMFSNNYEMHDYKFNQEFSYDEFIGYVKSLSYALKENDDNYDEYIFRLNRLFDKYSKNGKILFPMTTTLALGILR